MQSAAAAELARRVCARPRLLLCAVSAGLELYPNNPAVLRLQHLPALHHLAGPSLSAGHTADLRVFWLLAQVSAVRSLGCYQQHVCRFVLVSIIAILSDALVTQSVSRLYNSSILPHSAISNDTPNAMLFVLCLKANIPHTVFGPDASDSWAIPEAGHSAAAGAD